MTIATAFRGEKQLANPERDSTALTVVEVDLSTLSDELIKAPTYKVVQRILWTGTTHTKLYGQIRAIAELWRPVWIVVDATGVGEGLASFLSAAYPEKVIPFKFNLATKSSLGWGFLAIVETGRFKDWGITSDGIHPPETQADEYIRAQRKPLLRPEIYKPPSSSNAPPARWRSSPDPSIA